ncbi:predicted protein [Histoplasma capsulatum var. duboisii H88]|uniref:Predicted protein n=1 Tax=Ajellomyces capsulatus (strain H88) TaxID=544711 RepID=F0UFG4_AJEC8|nr:predicted protein [Histoplasma capsulatum var. duboisii H88]
MGRDRMGNSQLWQTRGNDAKWNWGRISPLRRYSHPEEWHLASELAMKIALRYGANGQTSRDYWPHGQPKRSRVHSAEKRLCNAGANDKTAKAD